MIRQRKLGTVEREFMWSFLFFIFIIFLFFKFHCWSAGGNIKEAGEDKKKSFRNPKKINQNLEIPYIELIDIDLRVSMKLGNMIRCLEQKI